MDGINNVTQLADRLTPFLIPRILKAIPAAGVIVGGNGGSAPGGGGGPGTEYTGGQGIDITGTVISADVGQGLGFDGSDRIRVRLGSPSGLDFNVAGDLVLSDGVAGFGLTISGKELSVSQSTSFTWTGAHVFQQNVNIAGDLIFQGANRKLRTLSNNNLWLQPHGTGRVLLNEFGTDIRTDQSITGFLGKGWQLNNDSVGWSHLDIRSIYAEELHVTAFIADYARVQVGETFLSNSSALLADVGDGFTIPAVSSSAKIYIEDVPDFVGQVFGNNDYVMLRFIERSAGLIVGTVWGQVTDYDDEPGIDDVQSYTFTTRSASGFLVGKTAKMGSLVIGFGQSGDAYIHQSVIANDGPWERYVSWVTNPYTPANRTLHMQLGNLDGVTDSELDPAGYGIYSDNAYLKGKVQTANTMLDNSGVTMNTTSRSDWNLVDGFKFERSLDDEYYGGLFGYWQSGASHRHVLGLRTTELAGRNEIIVNARSVGTGDAEIIIEASSAAFPAPDYQTRIQLLNGDTTQSRIRLNAKQIDLFGTGDSADRIATIALRPNLDATYDLGTATHQWKTLYVDEIIAGTITGDVALSGQIWQYDASDMHIRSTSASLRTLTITNPGAGTMNLNVEGSITLGGSVDGVNVSGFFATFNSRNLTAGDGLSGGGTLSADRSFAVDSTVVRTSRQINSGDGLTGGGNLSANRTLEVDSTVVRTSRTLTAGTGLTGGGTLAADRTFNVNQGFAFTWTAQHAFNRAAAGAPFTLNANAQGQTVVGFRADQLNKSVLAGNGLTGGGVLTADRTLTLGTPSQIHATSTDNVSSTSHTHSVLASSFPGPNERLLKSTTAGGLTLQSLDVVGAVTVGESLFAGNNTLRAIFHTHDYDHMHLVINPGPLWSLDEQFGVDIDDNLLVRGWIVGKHAIQLPGAKMLLHFDGPEPYNTNYVGNPTGHMGQVPVTNNNVIYRPGKYQKGAQIAQAATNLCTNPSFETNLTGWSAHTTGSAGGTVGRASGAGYYGNWAMSIVKNAGDTTDQYGRFFAFSATTSTTYTATAWVRVSAFSGGTGAVRLAMSGQGISVSHTITGLTNGWVRLQVTGTTSSTGFVNVLVYVHNANTATMFVDGVQIEQRGFATPYLDGSLGTGHAWTGSAHASTSTRSGATLRYAAENIDTQRGTVMAWVYHDGGTKGDLRRIFEMLDSGLYIRMIVQNSGGNSFPFAQYVSGTGSGNTFSGATSMPVGWNHVAMTWDVNDALRFYLNGTARGATGSYSAMPAANFAIGGRSDTSGDTFDEVIDDVVILDRAADAGEIRTVYESNAPVFAETSTWHWRAGRNRIYADSEGLWGLGATTGAILGLYAGEDNNPSATKSWGGRTLSEGDFLLGNAGRGAFMQWVNADAKIIIGREGATSSALILDGNEILMVRNAINRMRLASDNAFEMRDASDNLRFMIDAAGNLTIRDVSNVQRVAISAGGILSLRDPSNVHRVRVDASGNLTIRNGSDAAVFTFDSATGAEFTLPLTLGSAGGIWQGTGSFASPTTGLKIWRDGNIGRIAGYNSGTLQWGAGTDGRITAGGGSVGLSAFGLDLVRGAGLTYNVDSAVAWWSSLSARSSNADEASAFIEDTSKTGLEIIKNTLSPAVGSTIFISARPSSGSSVANVTMTALNSGVSTIVFSAGRVEMDAIGTWRVPRLTTTQRNALASVANGDVIYNTTTATFQGRAGGSWVNLS